MYSLRGSDYEWCFGKFDIFWGDGKQKLVKTGTFKLVKETSNNDVIVTPAYSITVGTT